MTFAPTPRDVRENRQDGKLVVVIPKKEWIVREKEEAKRDHDQSRSDRADYTGTRRPRVEHRAILTPNDERRRKQTPNAQWKTARSHFEFFSAVRMLVKKILISSSASLRIGVIFRDGSIAALFTSRSHRLVSFSSFKQTFNL